ncbi:unnamed protein product [Closterium sp. Yama58-4]|nr:unnamed protein product [Closterium sp. Yama58-4]
MAARVARRVGRISAVDRTPFVSALLAEAFAWRRTFVSSPTSPMSQASLASPSSSEMAASVGGNVAQAAGGSAPAGGSAGGSGAQAVGEGGTRTAESSARSGGDNARVVGKSGTRTIGGITARAAEGGGARATVRVVRADGMDVEAQLRLEEKLLRSDPTNSNWFVFNADVAAPTIVMGISGKPHELLHTEAVLEARVPVVRRFSGGGTVVLDSGSVLTSLICRRSAVPNLPLYPRPIMEWTEGLLQPAMTNVPGFALRDNDYVVGDLKVGGNAQSITGSSFLHHTSFLWDFCSHRMALLQQPSRAPEYREGRSHDQFITKLCQYYSTKDEFLRSVLVALALHFDLRATALHQVEALPFQPWKSGVALPASRQSRGTANKRISAPGSLTLFRSHYHSSRLVAKAAAAMSPLSGTPAAKTIVLPAKAGKHAATVVWLHGLGDTGYGWSDLCETVNLPHIKWILPSAPVAPVTINGGMPCPSWFDLFGLDASAQDDVKGIDAAARYVAGILEEEKRANPDVKFAVGGFSQGGALSLYLMSRKVLGKFEDGSDASSVPLHASVAFSGWLPKCSLKPGGSAAVGDASVAEKAAAHPLLMAHGEADSLVPFAFGKGSAQVLQEAGFSNLTFKSYRGMAHSACPEELADLKAWLQKNVPPPS